MKTSKALATRTRKSDIDTLIKKIKEANLNFFESYVQIGTNLGTIQEEGLFQSEGYKDFKAFLDDYPRHGFSFSASEAWQCIKIAERYRAIREIRDRQPEDIKDLVPLPSSQSQVKPLMKLSDSRAADTWISASIHAHKVQTPITNQFITDFVNNIGKVVDQEPAPTAGDSTEHADFSVQSVDGEQPRFSAAALEALSKIESLSPEVFPDGSRASIENELVAGIDNYVLETWNKHSEKEFKGIGRLIFNRSMTFDKAQRFITRPITANFTITDLVHYAIAHGGGFFFPVDDGRFKIIVEEIRQPAEAVA